MFDFTVNTAIVRTTLMWIGIWVTELLEFESHFNMDSVWGAEWVGGWSYFDVKWKTGIWTYFDVNNWMSSRMSMAWAHLDVNNCIIVWKVGISAHFDVSNHTSGWKTRIESTLMWTSVWVTVRLGFGILLWHKEPWVAGRLEFEPTLNLIWTGIWVTARLGFGKNHLIIWKTRVQKLFWCEQPHGFLEN